MGPQIAGCEAQSDSAVDTAGMSNATVDGYLDDMDGDDGFFPLDVLVIGAGISGIGFAQSYLSVHPDCRLLIVDRDTQPGGTWNAGRLFPTQRSPLGLGLAEFSDMHMALKPGEEVEQSFMEGRAVSRYLGEYIDRQIHNGTSLRARMQLGFEIRSTERQGRDWLAHGVAADGTVTTLRAHKLVVATGTTTTPHMPRLTNREAFRGFIVHQRDFGASPILAAESIQNVVVYGGGKSAADMAYACVQAGKTVTWIIRESGAGPAALMSAEGRGAYRNQPELASTRIMGSLSPSPWAPENTRTKFMGRTVLGRSIMVSPWAGADKAIHMLFDNAKLMGARDDFQLLRPRGYVFWANSQIGLVQHPDFWERISQEVCIRRADISAMRSNGIVLDSGVILPCDALVCGTGWDQTYPFFTDEQSHDLGLPVDMQSQTPAEAALWTDLQEEADQKLKKTWPAITNPPPYWHKKPTHTPFRLFRFIAPLQDREHSVVFLGQMTNSNAFRAAEVQALWATAYLDHRLPMPSLEHQRRDVAEVNVWCRRRYLINGMRGNCIHYDLTGYTDALLADLGLDAHRAGRSMWQWWARPNMAADLRGLRAEYLEKFEGIKRQSLESVVPDNRSWRAPSLKRKSSKGSFISLGRRSSTSLPPPIPVGRDDFRMP